jgi:mono/diheme cytochrome c family protein
MKSKRWMLTIAVMAVSTVFGSSIFPLTGESSASGEKKGSEVKQPAPSLKTTPPQIPSFAVSSKIPISGKQGPPGKAATLIGDRKKGESLFSKNCQSCHGAQGTDKVPNPGSSDGTVPPLKPIDPALADKDPSVFAANIDRFIQHGSMPTGSNPILFMPNWAAKLSQQDIANLEAYILHLNGVARKK